MVIESIISPWKAEKKPYEVFFVGFFYSSIALLLGVWVFQQQASLIMVFLTVMACLPLVYNVIKLEEQKDREIVKESLLLKEHAKALSVFILLFLGVTISFVVWYLILPKSLVQTVFSVQTKTIANINSQVTGNTIVQFSLFKKIFLNNIKVLVFCILFSFIYGAGAIFILIWNASVISAAIGNFIRSNIHLGYFQVAPLGILRYMTHGSLEILAYFIAGLAGGIISISLIKHDFSSKSFQHILTDSVDLILLSIGVLLLAGIVEVYITPILF